jgi:hypothetical protein
MPPGQLPWDGSVSRYGCKPGTIQTVNIDTGAVYGGALTALGLSKEFLREGLMPVLTARTAAPRRAENEKVTLRLIWADFLRNSREP